MGRGLDADRRTAAKAIDKTEFAKAWLWERDAKAGPRCAEADCIARARNADSLILLLGADLSRIVRREFSEARKAGRHCGVFIKQGQRRTSQVKKYICTLQKSLTTRNYRNSSELRTQVIGALFAAAVEAWRVADHYHAMRSAKRRSSR